MCGHSVVFWFSSQESDELPSSLPVAVFGDIRQVIGIVFAGILILCCVSVRNFIVLDGFDEFARKTRM